MQSTKGIVDTKVYLFLLFGSCILISCSIVNNNDEVTTECYLEEIQFDEFNSLTLQTLSGGRIYRMARENTSAGETNVLDSYKFNYFQDSLAIIDQSNTTTTEPFLSVRFEEDKPVEVVRFFYSAGVRLIHKVTYLEEGRVRVDLSRMDSLGDLFYVGYSLYHMNSDGNVIRNEQFRADSEDSTSFTKILDRAYSYDSFDSPQEDLFLPFFANPNFPEVQFFSENNILTYTEDGQTRDYQYEYGPDENVVTQVSPSGHSLFFSYSNCEEE